MCRHDATFHGEDLEMGYITHKLSGRNKLEGGNDDADTNHRIALMKDCIVPTTVWGPGRARGTFDALVFAKEHQGDGSEDDCADCCLCGYPTAEPIRDLFTLGYLDFS
jgi:hypothetical protein